MPFFFCQSTKNLANVHCFAIDFNVRNMAFIVNDVLFRGTLLALSLWLGGKTSRKLVNSSDDIRGNK